MAYKKRKISILDTRESDEYMAYPSSTEQFHSFGYYVLGGTDISGDALMMNGNAEFDTDDEINAGVGIDATCNPRIGFFQLVESVGKQMAEKVVENSPTNQVQDTKTEQTE